jgi:hypothetical protein
LEILPSPYGGRRKVQLIWEKNMKNRREKWEKNK